MKQLHLGKIPSKELAKWFGYAYSTYRKKKPQLLGYLKQYCNYEEIYGGIFVKEIFSLNMKEIYYLKMFKNILIK